eukprot:TRINITY_DN4809_c0_g1_i3.p2 TRINITY_DN4809_c0_g1~~TRINITY_DN4809_c0_g1_i3.p2  ORF type:complete len:195 (-),score=27.06 TRINITY_DN4809_c0_g1_i3:131-715(-)
MVDCWGCFICVLPYRPCITCAGLGLGNESTHMVNQYSWSNQTVSNTARTLMASAGPALMQQHLCKAVSRSGAFSTAAIALTISSTASTLMASAGRASTHKHSCKATAVGHQRCRRSTDSTCAKQSAAVGGLSTTAIALTTHPSPPAAPPLLCRRQATRQSADPNQPYNFAQDYYGGKRDGGADGAAALSDDDDL